MSSPDFDAIVVGAGVIGLAIARQLALKSHSVLVIESAGRAGTETSSRNSEVIHAGIYYPKGSLKARLCVEGKAPLYEFCASHGVAHKRIGKLIVATSVEEESKLQSIMTSAKGNGVDDLQWLTKTEVADLEPELSCASALFSPSTGIVDAAGYVLALQGDAEVLGTAFAFNTKFVEAEKRDGHFVVKAADSTGEMTEVTSRLLFNCAGHGAHEVAGRIANFPTQVLPPRYLAKGCYCNVSGKNPFRYLIYPVPVSGALGIHATLDVGGAVRFGPDITWVDQLDYGMPDHLEAKFKAAIQNYWPAVNARELSPSYCGIRPKIHGPDSGFADFEIQTETAHGFSGLVNLFGIESPGLTSSLAIANLVT